MTENQIARKSTIRKALRAAEEAEYPATGNDRNKYPRWEWRLNQEIIVNKLKGLLEK